MPALTARLLLAALALASCAQDENEAHRWDAESGTCDAIDCTSLRLTPTPCFATLCLGGAGYDLSDGNLYLEELCALQPGPISSCSAEGCRPIFYDVEAAWLAATDVLAQMNAGAEIFGSSVPREQCQLALVGHSWGAFDAAELAARIAATERPGFRVDRFVALDAYRAPEPAVLDVPPGVVEARGFFHGAITREDCSELWGNFAGRPLRCDGRQDCRQWDLGGGAGSSGHCGLVIEASGWTHAFLRYGADTGPEDLERDVERR